MAKKVITTVTDDIDGSDGATTVSFSLEGQAYEIDLSDRNLGKLQDALAPYIQAGTRVRGAGGSQSRTARSRATSDRDLNAVREWARKNGHEVSDRGRIAQPILEAYDAAH